MVGNALFANLLFRAACADWMDQLDPIAIDDAQQTWLDQETLGPILMNSKEPEQTSAFGQFWEEFLVIALGKVVA